LIFLNILQLNKTTMKYYYNFL